MGQKVNPIGLRLGINRTWDSRWYSGKGDYGKLLHEDMEIREDLSKALNSAIANAENNHNLDVDRLVVAEASVGKGLVMKRFQTRGRGRAAGIVKPFSHLTIVVRERPETSDAAEEK